MWCKSILYLVPSSVVFARFHLPIVDCMHTKECHQIDFGIIGILDVFIIIFHVKQLLLKFRANTLSENSPTSVTNWSNVNVFLQRHITKTVLKRTRTNCYFTVFLFYINVGHIGTSF